MRNIYKILKKILYSGHSFFLLVVLGMFLSALYTEMSLYQIFSGTVSGMARQLLVLFLYLSFLAMLLIILYLLVWEWLKNCAKQFQVLVLCGQTDLDLYHMFCRIFFVWYLLAYIAGSVIFYFSVRLAKISCVACSIGSSFIILLFLQMIFAHVVVRRYFEG